MDVSDSDHDRDQRRRPLRLKRYDYALAGAYFVTIVVQNRSCLFGEVVGEEMRLNDAGKLARREWEALPYRFPSIDIDVFVIMPNHLHGIAMIGQSAKAPTWGAPSRDGVTETVATPSNKTATRSFPTLGDVVGTYKSLTTVEYVRGVNTLAWPRFSDRLWQRNYYEHVIRHDESLREIRQYILNNPARWALDPENR